MLDTPLPRLHATAPEPLPFAPSLHIRAFVLERDHGNLLVYAAPAVGTAAPAPLPFAPSLHIRAFVLEREHGNLAA